jgi:uncharacterized protein YndB with AHSA1/START domain
MSSDNAFTISRLFDASHDAVWSAWTIPGTIAAWLGPKGSASRVVHHDLRPGGSMLQCLTMPGGIEMWGKHVYRDVVPQSRLVWEHSFSDENGDITRHPFAPTWPLKLLTTVSFESARDKTRVTLVWEPLDATDIEAATFAAGMAGMEIGWGGSFDQLAELLAAA